MRFTIQTDIFRRAIDATSHATNTGNLTPVLENLLIEASDEGFVTLTGNNLDMAIEYKISDGVSVEASGKYTLSARFLTSYISLVNDNEVTVELDKPGSITLSTQSGKTKVKGIEAEKFPSIPHINVDNPILMDAQELKNSIEKTLFSTADGSVRPMLAGIFINPQEDKIIFASTDSFRLSDYHFTPKHPVLHSAIILPKKTALELSRLMNENIQDIKMYTEDSQILIEIGDIRLTSRLLAGKFPEYSNFFPKEFQTRTTVLRSEFINAIKQVDLVAKNDNHNIRIRSLSDNQIQIFTGETEIGNSERFLSATVE